MQGYTTSIGHNQGPPINDDRRDAKPRLGQSYACPKVLIRDLPAGLVPEHYFTVIEKNDERRPDGSLVALDCCRQIRAHGFIEAWYSSQRDKRRKIPDIYVLTCGECGRLHRRFCVGGSIGSRAKPEYRPKWTAIEASR